MNRKEMEGEKGRRRKMMKKIENPRERCKKEKWRKR